MRNGLTKWGFNQAIIELGNGRNVIFKRQVDSEVWHSGGFYEKAEWKLQVYHRVTSWEVATENFLWELLKRATYLSQTKKWLSSSLITRVDVIPPSFRKNPCNSGILTPEMCDKWHECLCANKTVSSDLLLLRARPLCCTFEYYALEHWSNVS